MLHWQIGLKTWRLEWNSNNIRETNNKNTRDKNNRKIKHKGYVNVILSLHDHWRLSFRTEPAHSLSAAVSFHHLVLHHQRVGFRRHFPRHPVSTDHHKENSWQERHYLDHLLQSGKHQMIRTKSMNRHLVENSMKWHYKLPTLGCYTLKTEIKKLEWAIIILKRSKL